MITLSIERGQAAFDCQELSRLSATVKAIIYARVSTQDQAKHGYSLESQVERAGAFAQAKFGIREDEVLAVMEQGEMGDDPNRPALNYVLGLMERGVGSKLIVLHPDRLARDLKLQLYITERIWNAGCDIAFVEMDVDPDNPESVLLYNIQGAIAQYNKAKILANSKRGRRTKARNGKIPGIRRVYGYTFDKDNDVLVENPEEKTTYLRMVDWFLNGKDGRAMNLTSIAKELSLLGIPAPSGDKWYQATVSRILKNPAYTGTFYYGKTESRQKAGSKEIIKKPAQEWQMIPVPAYIDQGTFHRLQRKLCSLERHGRGAPPKAPYLLKGLVRCGRCGSAVVAGAPSRNKKTKEILYHYYVCSGKTRKVFEVGTGSPVHACPGRNWRQDVVDKFVWNYLVECLKVRSGAIADVICCETEEVRVRELRERRDRLENVIESKRAERKRWLNLNAKGRIADDELDQVLTPLERDIEQLKVLLQTTDDTLLSAIRGIDGAKPIVERFLQYIESDISVEDKRRYIHLMVNQVVLHDDEIHVYAAWDFLLPSENDFLHGIVFDTGSLKDIKPS